MREKINNNEHFKVLKGLINTNKLHFKGKIETNKSIQRIPIETTIEDHILKYTND